MKPIALVYTGGTIGARVTDGAADASPGGGRLLTEVFRRRHPDSPALFDEREPLNTLSENMTVEKWNALLDALRDLEPDSFAGVILTHGTDTLAYTANLLALVLEGTALPVVLVSSHTPPADPAANGHRHFAAAVQAMEQGLPGGVYAAVSDLADAPGSREVRLIPGQRLTQCAGLTDRFGLAPPPPGRRGGEPLLYRLPPLTPCVVQVQPYPGLNYQTVALPAGTRAVLHGLYHSGTACMQGEATGFPGFAARCRRAGTLLALCPARPEGTPYHYASEQGLKAGGVLPLPGVTMERAYALLLVACALHSSSDEAAAFIRDRL